MLSQADRAIPDVLFSSRLFREAERARQELERIRSRAPQELTAALVSLLSDSPDPQQALSFCEKLIGQASDDLIHLLDRKRVLLHYAMVIFGHSHWLGEALLRNRDLVGSLDREHSLERLLSREDYRRRLLQFRPSAFAADVSTLLARFKKREYIRIALRDALGLATLAETAEELSALAGAIIEEALGEARSSMGKRRPDAPSPDLRDGPAEAAFSVVALGKLGGNELNYSSDVDLLYLYDGHESSPAHDAREYFVRLAQLLTDILSRVTAEGAVFRIDLRLRPQGQEGEPALGLRHALDYYAHAAHDWELQALIKARYAAGDAALARAFIRGVERQVYTEDLNFEAVATALHSREKLGARRRRLAAAGKGPATIDVKLDPGGIRDIEFLVQCLQRVYGGSEPWLRSSGTLFSLQKLHDKGHLSSRDFHELTVAYEFLRKIEHRLQLQRGRQVHRLPQEAVEIEVLYRAVSGGPVSREPVSREPVSREPASRERRDEGADTFLSSLQSRMASVAEIYERVVHSQRRDGPAEQGEPPRLASSAPEAAVRPLSFEQLWQRAFPDTPMPPALAYRGEVSLHSRRALDRFLGSAMTGPDRYAAMKENPALVERAVALLETSGYITDILVQHPEELRALEGLPRASASEQDVNGALPCGESPGVESNTSLSEAMAALRRSFRQRMFAAAAQDILAPRPALNSMRETTAAADAAVGAALRMVAGEDVLAVFALGRQGTHEFDIASDADLLFVRDSRTGEDPARAVAEKLIHALAAYTREGSLFAVDARLRPHGGEGDLVATPAQLDKYLADEAQPWEALTYTKLRFVAGRKDVAAATRPLVWRRIVEMARTPGFPRQVLEMRTRLEKSNRYPRSFKLARGGFYDIDFLASFLLLKEGVFAHGNTLGRLEHLDENGLLEKPAATTLKEAALLYRSADHVIRLVTGHARPELPEAEHARGVVETLVNKILGRDSGDLQAELEATKGQVRDIFAQAVPV